LSDLVININTGAATTAADQVADSLRAADVAADQVAAATDQMTADLRSAATASDRVDDSLDDVRHSADRAADEVGRIDNEARNASGSFQSLAGSLRNLAIGVGLAVGLNEVRQFFQGAVSEASSLAESVNAVQVVFGDASQTILDFGADTSDAVFLAASEFNQLATATGNLLQGFGLGVQDAADITIELTNRAADLASVFNTEVAVALDAINAALRGETEQIRRFTGSFSVEEVKDFGRELFGVTGELTSQQTVLAAVELIMSRTAAVQGDAANTAGELANQQRALTEVWAEFQVTVGQLLVPALEALLPLLTELAEKGAKDIPVVAQTIDDTVTAASSLGTSLGKAAAAAVSFVTLDWGSSASQLRESADAGNDFFDVTVGARSILRDFVSQLSDGTDNVTDYANALATVADSDNLIRLFDDITAAAERGGVGIEAQASALRTLIQSGQLSGEQLRFVTQQFNDLAIALGRPELRQSEGLFGDLSYTVSTFALSLNDAGTESTFAQDRISALGTSLGSVTEEGGFAASRIDAIGDSLGNVVSLSDRLESISGTFGSISRAADIAAGDLIPVAEGFEDAAQAAADFRTATLELSDPVFAAARAQERLTDAEQALTDLRASGEASAQDIANASLDLAEAALEADAAARGLGDINLEGGAFNRSIGVLAAALGTNRDTVYELLEAAGVLDDTTAEPEVVFLVDDQEIQRALEGIPSAVDVAVRFAATGTLPGSIGGLLSGAVQPGTATSTTTVSVAINNPTDSDIKGNAAQAGAIIGSIPALVPQ
jgi:hypothetical protein